MPGLLDPNVSPSPGAFTANPFTAVEIDEHVDGNRIWATVLEVREDLERYEASASQRAQDAEQGERDARSQLENADHVIDPEAALKALTKFRSDGFKRADLDALHKTLTGA